VRAKANEIDGYKLWYSGLKRAKNGVGILVGRELVERVVEMRRKSDHIMSVKLVVGSEIFNIVSVYAPQIGLEEDLRGYSGRNSMRLSKVYRRLRNLSLGVTLMVI